MPAQVPSHHEPIIAVEDHAPQGWDAYAARHPLATAYHREAAVLVGNRTFGLRTWFLSARDGDDLVGILPLVEQSSRFFGHFLTSVPFFTYGGILADDDTTVHAILQGLRMHCEARRVQHAELRHAGPLRGESLPERVDKVSMIVDLPSSEDALSRQLGSKLRSQIKRAQREQPEVIWGRGELIPEFFRVFSQCMRDLGTPVYPRRFFEIACNALGELASVLVIRVRGEVMAGAILVRHGDRIEVPWAAATDEAKRNAINMRMYWEMLAHSMRAAAREFDFGRSTIDSGTFRFKQQWGAKPRQLHWQYWLSPGSEVPMLNNSNAKYALATAAWKRLPLWCANLIGPMIIRNLP
jgi:FemAB-related protein (PEP-CTERM system-associated)